MNPLKAISNLLLAGVIFAALASAATEPTASELRKLTAQERSKAGFKADSVGTPVRVIDLSERKKDFWLIPVLRSGKLVSVYRDDPRRESVTEVAALTALRTAKSELFASDAAAREMTQAGVEQADPVLVYCGPISVLGATNCAWYQRAGESFVLLSLSGKIISEAEVEQFWPDRLEALRKFRK